MDTQKLLDDEQDQEILICSWQIQQQIPLDQQGTGDGAFILTHMNITEILGD